MSDFIDTNVLAELRQREPNADAVARFANRPSRMFYLGALTLGEIRTGLETVPDRERRLPAIDTLLAATALHHQLRLVTRNEKDFNYPGLEAINPWSFACTGRRCLMMVASASPIAGNPPERGPMGQLVC